MLTYVARHAATLEQLLCVTSLATISANVTTIQFNVTTFPTTGHLRVLENGCLFELIGIRKALSILFRVPEIQNKNPLLLDLVTHFIIADDQAPHFAWFEFFQLFAHVRMLIQAFRGDRKGSHDVDCGLPIHSGQETM